VDIPPGQTVVSLSITPVDDGIVEGDETAILSIAPDPSYDIGAPPSVTLGIHDGDASTAYALADAHVRDGEAAAATNFGAANVLETRLGGPGENAEAYLKFDVSGRQPRRFERAAAPVRPPGRRRVGGARGDLGLRRGRVGVG
jgi:hypothetical protein